LWKKGFRFVAGLDEAGRGPLAGPVVAAAVVMKKSLRKIDILREVKDSKKLSPKKREKLYKILKNCPFIGWGIGRVSEKVIDKINILEATKLAMVKAVKKLKRRPDFLILDGNFTLPSVALARAGISPNTPQKSIVKADDKVFSCAAASILAKVYRDKIMRKYHEKYPQYGFDKHKGYPTKYHLKMLKKYGSSKIHRKSFGPVAKVQKRNTCKILRNMIS
jgi:ribonuclease HII